MVVVVPVSATVAVVVVVVVVPPGLVGAAPSGAGKATGGDKRGGEEGWRYSGGVAPFNSPKQR